jgi:peptide chain release factor 2
VSDGAGGTVSLSVADIRAQLADAFIEIGTLEQTVNVAKLKEELHSLDQQSSSPAFWETAFGDTSVIARRHRLTAEVRRLESLHRELLAVHELAEASFVEADDSVARELMNSFARFAPRLRRAQRELLKFEDVDSADAELLITPVGEEIGAREWAAKLADMYEAWARSVGYEVRRSEQENVLKVVVMGPYAHGYLRGETGGHRVVRPHDERGPRRSEAHLARVRVTPPGEETQEELRLDDLDPIRTYDTRHSHGVRDRVTRHTDGDTKRVLMGRISAFLEAHIDQR